jgi:hypothetical protein
MRDHTSDPTQTKRFHGRAISDFDPAGVGMFTRLGVLLLIAVCFGLVAQLLVGVSH